MSATIHTLSSVVEDPNAKQRPRGVRHGSLEGVATKRDERRVGMQGAGLVLVCSLECSVCGWKTDGGAREILQLSEARFARMLPQPTPSDLFRKREDVLSLCRV